ncbi:MAG: ArsR/SmtB family transcription factor [Promethearchaeota archaeon]
MITSDFSSLVELLRVLGDATRLDILMLLKDGERYPNSIMKYIGKSQSTVSQHLATLVNADLLSVRQEGNKRMFSIKMPEIFDFLRILNEMNSKIKRKMIEEISEKAVDDTLL